MKVAILYICTGRYYIFWKQFFKSAEKNLLNGIEKHYFVFTDYKGKLYGDERGKITKIYQKKLGWPNDTLMRFEIFLKAEEQLKNYDFIYFFNANMKIILPVGTEILPDREGLVGVLHPFYFNQERKTFTYDKNPQSLAFIAENEGEHYFMGGLNGGKSKNYLKLIRDLNSNIKKDLEKNIIAKWHDESHLNRYLVDHPVKILSEKYGAAENLWNVKNPKIIVLNKAHPKYGGHDWLRGVSDKRLSFFKFYRQNIVNKFKSYIKK